METIVLLQHAVGVFLCQERELVRSLFISKIPIKTPTFQFVLFQCSELIQLFIFNKIRQYRINNDNFQELKTGRKACVSAYKQLKISFDSVLIF